MRRKLQQKSEPAWTKPLANWGGDLSRFSRAFGEALLPPPNLTVSQWADEHRKLSRESSAEPGQFRTDRAPFQRELMDVTCDPKVKRVVMMKCAQVGFTECLLNVMGYFVDQDPAPLLFVMPTVEMGRAFSKDRLAPMFRDTPRLKGKVSEAGSKKGDNATFHKKFDGGHLTITGANSAAGLSSRPIRVVLCDEIDRYPPSAGSEGDPVNLAVKRAATFWNRVEVLGGTPTEKGNSRIEGAYEASDQRRYYVPCPHCEHKSPLWFRDFDFSDAGTPEDPVWVCHECGGIATDVDKLQMLEGGEWVAEAEFNGVAGFHINEFYSPWRAWGEIIADFLTAKGDPQQLKTWVNTSLGETWEESGESIEPEGLAARREIYQTQVPHGVEVITAGVDIQQDRFEVYVWGWGKDWERWLIERQDITADTSLLTEWARLDDYLVNTTFEGGHQIAAACVDSGYQTDQVYAYCAKRFARRFWAIKGYEGEGRPVVAPMAKPKAGIKPKRMFALGVDTIKGRLYDDLQVTEPGPNCTHFPIDTDAQVFAELTSEKRVTKYVRGFRRSQWKKIKQRNEAWDCLIYAFAAIMILNPVWGHTVQPRASQRRIRSRAVGNH